MNPIIAPMIIGIAINHHTNLDVFSRIFSFLWKFFRSTQIISIKSSFSLLLLYCSKNLSLCVDDCDVDFIDYFLLPFLLVEEFPFEVFGGLLLLPLPDGRPVVLGAFLSPLYFAMI